MKKLICLILTVTCLLGLAACGGNAGVTPDMQKVYSDMAGKLPAMEPFTAEAVLNAYGIKAEDCKQMVVSSYYDGAATAEIWLIEASDETAAEQIKTLAQNRLNSMGEQFRSYDAKAYQLVENAQLITHGNCLALIVAEDAASLAQIYNTAAQLN